MIKFNNFLYNFLHTKYAIVWLMLTFLSGNILISLDNFIFNIVGIIIYILMVFLMMSMIKGKIKLDLSIYDIPEKGEKIIITKDFYWNGAFLKYPEHGQGAKPWYFKIKKYEEWEVYEVKKEYENYTLSLIHDQKRDININFLESRKYWTTLAEIRNNKLKKLKI